MCLAKSTVYVNKREDIKKFLKTSPQDIVCYKFLKRKHRWWPFSAITPYRDEPINFITLKGLKNFSSGFSGEKLLDVLVDSSTSGSYRGFEKDLNITYVIGEGLIHTFKKYYDVKGIDPSCWDKKIDIWECVIPAGTQYIEGNAPGFGECYGSTEIKFIRRVK